MLVSNYLFPGIQKYGLQQGQHRTAWQWQPAAHDPAPPIDLLDPVLTAGAISSMFSSGYHAQLEVLRDAFGGTAPIALQWQRSAAGAGTWSDLTVGSADQRMLLDESASPSTSYDYRLRFADAAAAVVYSNTITIAVPAEVEGWALMGDSLTDEYRGDALLNAGTPYEAVTLGWAEIMANERAFPIGAWSATPRDEPRRIGYANNWARGGAGSNYIANGGLSHMGVLGQLQQGIVTHVAIICPINDWLFWLPYIYAGDGTVTGGAIPGVALTLLADLFVKNISQAINACVNAGAAGIAVQTPTNYIDRVDYRITYPDVTKRGYFEGVAASVKTQVDTLATTWNTYAGHTLVTTWELESETVFENAKAASTTIGGVPILPLAGVDLRVEQSPNGEPTYFYIKTDTTHDMTVVHGVKANVFIGHANDLNGISYSLLTDQEIREIAGIDQGAAAVGLGGLTTTGAGQVLVSGTAAVSLGALTVSGAGTGLNITTGAGAVTLGAITVVAAATVAVQAAGTVSLGTLAISGAAIIVHLGAGASSLGTITLSAAGVVPAAGAGALSLGALLIEGRNIEPKPSQTVTMGARSFSWTARGRSQTWTAPGR